MAAKKEIGFRVGGPKGLFFRLISSDKFKQGDVPLIEAVTGKDWEAFRKLVKKHGLDHALVLQGFFAVALQRARDASLEDVVEFIHDLPLGEGIVLEVPDPPKQKEGDEADPTPPADETENSET